MKKTYEKFFEYKGQMINYYNKVRKNPNVGFCMAGFDGPKNYTTRRSSLSRKTFKKTAQKLSFPKCGFCAK